MCQTSSHRLSSSKRTAIDFQKAADGDTRCSTTKPHPTSSRPIPAPQTAGTRAMSQRRQRITFFTRTRSGERHRGKHERQAGARRADRRRDRRQLGHRARDRPARPRRGSFRGRCAELEVQCRRCKMAEQINHGRRRLLGTAVLTLAAAELATIGSAYAHSRKINPIKPGTNTSFGSLKQIDAGILNIGYAEAGPANGPPVILLHGWPYDIHSFVEVAPLLASAGYHVYVPYLRGYGSTRFLSGETFRNAQPSAVAVDVIDFMNALKIDKAVLAGFDWGARTINIVSALWPERTKATVSVSGYLIGSPEANKAPAPPKAEFDYWYQFY